MEVNDFCSSLRDEMTSWKAKTHDFISGTEGASPAPDPKMKASVEDLKIMIEQIEQSLQRLERECPVDWSSEKMEIESAMRELHARWSDTASYSPDDFD